MTRRALLAAAAVVAAVVALPADAGAQAPTQDSVVLTGGPGQAFQETVIALDATSGPSGEHPSGQVRFDAIGFQLGGPVTCLAVTGNSAIINFQNQLTAGFGITTVHVVDNQPGNVNGDPDVFDAIPTGRAATDCSPLPPTGFGGGLEGADIAVVDAPPLPPSPTAKDQCRNGGWRDFGAMFKNQGQCVALVERGPKS